MATPMQFGTGGRQTASILDFRVIDPQAYWDFESEYASQQTNIEMVVAPGVGVSIWITDIYIAVNSAVTVTVSDGSGAVKWKYYASGQGDGVSKRLRCPIKCAVNQNLRITSSNGATFFIAVTGYLS